ncbi:MAG: hypothetical protein Q7T80_02030, partial [Methanoregula sp.]|nr:hypothetical protein [Methanoregula sp.]
MFTEWSADDREEVIQEQVDKIRGVSTSAAGRSPYAYTGERRTSADPGMAGRREPSLRQDARSTRTSPGRMADSGIDFIPEGGSPGESISPVRAPPSRRSSDISFEERRNPQQTDDRRFSAGKSVEIPLEERFGKARGERESLSKGRSAEISVGERFESARSDRESLSKGRSAEISLDERFGNAHGDREKLSKGGSADISLDERFEKARSEREKLSKGRSAEIPYSERKAGRDR